MLITMLCMCVGLTGCTDNPPSLQNVVSTPTIITGNLKVYYDIQSSETSSYGTGNSPAEVSEIQFFDQYIVIKTGAKNGKVLPISRIKAFRWDQSQ